MEWAKVMGEGAKQEAQGKPLLAEDALSIS
jgi:hypothetical protein